MARPRFSEATAQFRELANLKDDARLRINLAQCLVRDACSKKDQLEERITRLRAPFHPVRRIPPEVLGQIFEACLPDYAAWEPPTTAAQRRRIPFSLAAVCRLWRTAALIHPRIWSYIDVDMYRIDDGNVGWYKSQLRFLLGRAGVVPLQILLVSRKKDQDCDMQSRRFLESEILPLLTRCEVLFVVLHLVRDLLPVLFAQSMPLLHHSLCLRLASQHSGSLKSRQVAHSHLLSHRGSPVLSLRFPREGDACSLPQRFCV